MQNAVRLLITAALLGTALAPAVAAASFDRDLHFGMRHDKEVLTLQRFLSEEGYYDGPLNGSFLSNTKEAVASLQEDEQIHPAFGYFGAITRARVNAMLGTTSAAASTPAATSSALTDRVFGSSTDVDTLAQEIAELQAQYDELQTQVQSISEAMDALISTVQDLSSTISAPATVSATNSPSSLSTQLTTTSTASSGTSGTSQSATQTATSGTGGASSSTSVHGGKK